MTKARKGKPIYHRGSLYVSESYDAVKDKVYYTVVNCENNMHRHYNYMLQAIMTCKWAGRGVIPPGYSTAARRDMYYLLHGTEEGFE